MWPPLEACDNRNTFTYCQMYFNTEQAAFPWQIKTSFHRTLQMPPSACSVPLPFGARSQPQVPAGEQGDFNPRQQSLSGVRELSEQQPLSVRRHKTTVFSLCQYSSPPLQALLGRQAIPSASLCSQGVQRELQTPWKPLSHASSRS